MNRRARLAALEPRSPGWRGLARSWNPDVAVEVAGGGMMRHGRTVTGFFAADTWPGLVHKADMALYDLKDGGRGRGTLAGPR